MEKWWRLFGEQVEWGEGRSQPCTLPQCGVLTCEHSSRGRN